MTTRWRRGRCDVVWGRGTRAAGPEVSRDGWAGGETARGGTKAREGALRMANILIVDDQPDIRRVLVRLVRLAGHDPAAAAGGEEALSFLQSHVPDLILLDVMMPEVDGFAVLRAVRRDPRTARVRVVMFSAL